MPTQTNKHTVTVTLKDGTVIKDDLFHVDIIEQWLDLIEHPHPINFDSCSSVVDALGNDLLKQWTADNADRTTRVGCNLCAAGKEPV